ncbi:MAG TPA: MmgE/PrpD family protein [Chloroflexota bacterium]|nr:MmgE/PrpD family protein [Chloroflexota bacterium]
MSSLEALAERLAALDTAALPLRARDAARLHVLDTLAAWAAALDSPWHRTLATLAPPGPDGEVLVGAALAHCHEADDLFDPALLCIGGAVVPAALALGRARRASGAALLAAVVTGYEAMGRLGLALGAGALLARGLWPTAVCAAFGAAAAAGRLLGLTPAALADALALAAQHGGGLAGGADGMAGRNLLYGQLARAGLLAAQAAAAGVAGPRSLFGGPRGLAVALGGEWDPAPLERGQPPLVIERTAIKPYPCARQLHGAVEAALAWRATGQPARLRRVVVRLPAAARFLDRPGAEGLRAPAGSAQWVLAAALAGGRVLPEDLAPAALARPAVAALAARVEVVPAPLPPLAAALALHTDEGVWEREVPVPRGGPERPLSATEVEDKALALAAPRLGDAAAERLVGLARALDRLDHLEELAALVCRAPGLPAAV